MSRVTHVPPSERLGTAYSHEITRAFTRKPASVTTTASPTTVTTTKAQARAFRARFGSLALNFLPLGLGLRARAQLQPAARQGADFAES